MTLAIVEHHDLTEGWTASVYSDGSMDIEGPDHTSIVLALDVEQVDKLRQIVNDIPR
jgi:hypothetical protein